MDYIVTMKKTGWTKAQCQQNEKRARALHAHITVLWQNHVNLSRFETMTQKGLNMEMSKFHLQHLSGLGQEFGCFPSCATFETAHKATLKNPYEKTSKRKDIIPELIRKVPESIVAELDDFDYALRTAPDVETCLLGMAKKLPPAVRLEATFVKASLVKGLRIHVADGDITESLEPFMHPDICVEFPIHLRMLLGDHEYQKVGTDIVVRVMGGVQYAGATNSDHFDTGNLYNSPAIASLKQPMYSALCYSRQGESCVGVLFSSFSVQRGSDVKAEVFFIVAKMKYDTTLDRPRWWPFDRYVWEQQGENHLVYDIVRADDFIDHLWLEPNMSTEASLSKNTISANDQYWLVSRRLFEGNGAELTEPYTDNEDTAQQYINANQARWVAECDKVYNYIDYSAEVPVQIFSQTL